MRPGAASMFDIALAHHQAGRPETARGLYRGLLAEDPEHAEALHLLGLIVAQEGDPAGGAAMIQRAMALAPGRAPHRNSLAMVWRLMGRDEDAADEYRAAAALRPDSAEIRNNLAATLLSLGRRQEGLAAYRQAAVLSPGTAEIWHNLACALDAPEESEEAELCFRRAIATRADFAAAIASIGRFLLTRARWAEAEACLREAVRLTPNDATAWSQLGIPAQETGRAAEAEACYRRAIALDPGHADAHHNLGCLLAGEGKADAAIACHEAALSADPSHGAARLAACMAKLPILYESEADVTARRARYLAALDRLDAAAKDPAIARSLGRAIGTSQPFFLPYQGQNDVAAQSAYGRLACRLAKQRPVPLATPPRAHERIRVGIVSGFFHDHTIFRLFLEGWLSRIDRDRFELTGFHTGRVSDASTAQARNRADRFFQHLPSPEDWVDAIAGTAPHVLLYPEVGMDPVAGRLAAHRLAPVQCLAWGHPVTSGLPTMDFFLSSDLMEPADGAAHYTEHLTRLPGLGVHYSPETLPDLSRPDLTRDGPVFWSGQALYKYAPDHDAIYPRIAKATGACRFVFIDFAKSETVTHMFRGRLTRAFAESGLDADRYCVFLPAMAQERYLAAMAAADVLLDTPGWSGGRSTLDCLAANPAIVSWPGPFMRRRHTAAILRQIGCEDTIAKDLEDYIAIAVRLGHDTVWRETIRRAVARNKHRAFRDDAPIRSLETFLENAVRG